MLSKPHIENQSNNPLLVKEDECFNPLSPSLGYNGTPENKRTSERTKKKQNRTKNGGKKEVRVLKG